MDDKKWIIPDHLVAALDPGADKTAVAVFDKKTGKLEASWTANISLEEAKIQQALLQATFDRMKRDSSWFAYQLSPLDMETQELVWTDDDDAWQYLRERGFTASVVDADGACIIGTPPEKLGRPLSTFESSAIHFLIDWYGWAYDAYEGEPVEWE